jgi:hypothetical protein
MLVARRLCLFSFTINVLVDQFSSVQHFCFYFNAQLIAVQDNRDKSKKLTIGKEEIKNNKLSFFPFTLTFSL